MALTYHRSQRLPARVGHFSASDYTVEAYFCVDALREALRLVQPEVFNTDQGSQFTSLEFTQVLQEHGVKISMDGKGR